MDLKNISKVAAGFKKDNLEPTADDIAKADIRYNNLKSWFFKVLEGSFKKEFIIDAENEKQLDLVFWYYSRHPNFLKPENKTSSIVNDYSFDKGLMFVGSVGCGKTTIVNTIIKVLQNFQKAFLSHSCLDVEEDFANNGYAALEKYGKPFIKNFDDLGFDDVVKFYGNEERIMIRVIEKRHRLFIDFNIPTHFTTNLGGEELKKRYGVRIHSRLKEMCNIITFKNDAKDRRK